MTARPLVTLIATGGTIAGAAASAADTTGYQAGSLQAEALVAAIPGIEDVAELRIEQLFNLDSRDMGPAHWIALGQRVRAALDDAAVAGIVITHGTDTLEETAAFLDAILPSAKPVVLTGAMRPATALSADGPMNLYHAIALAAHPASGGRGVMVSFGEEILAAAGVRKCHTGRLPAFCPAEGGLLGKSGPVRFYVPACPRPALLPLPADAGRLPRVDVLYVGAGCSPDALDHAVASGARGIVLALPGNGSVPATWREPIKFAVAAGVPVVRGTRAGAGEVGRKADDDELGTLPAGDRPLSGVRVLMMLALAAGGPGLCARVFTPD